MCIYIGVQGRGADLLLTEKSCLAHILAQTFSLQRRAASHIYWRRPSPYREELPRTYYREELPRTYIGADLLLTEKSCLASHIFMLSIHACTFFEHIKCCTSQRTSFLQLHVRVYVCDCVCIYVCMYISINEPLPSTACMCICVCLCMYVSMSLLSSTECMYVRVHALSVCECVYICIYLRS
jgi:hypothetical protein